MIESLVNLPEGFNVGVLGALASGSCLRKMWRAAIAVATSTGFRKAEMFQSNETTFFLHWNNIHWNICGKLTSSKDVTNEQLSSLVISPVPSKSDQFNTVWVHIHCMCLSTTGLGMLWQQ
jgi:hypothetical protein